ncbi:MAG: hypothetical protein WAL35_05035 [Acidimicrobiales bacterium]
MEAPEILARSDFTYRPEDGSGPWRVRLTMALVDGHPAVVAVEMFGVDPRHVAAELPNAPERVLWPADLPAFTAPISATDVRLPLARLREAWERETYRRAVHVRDVDSWKMTATARAYAARIVELFDDAPSPGGRPPKYGRAHFEKVAALYNFADSTGRDPTRYVVAEWKRREGIKIGYSTAQKWIARCRRDFDPPLLPPTGRGKVVSGEPGRKRGERS